MSILGRLMGTAESAARGTAGGRRGTARPARGKARSTGRGMSRRRAATPARTSGIGRLVEGFLRRR
jgi:hypothetical protein